MAGSTRVCGAASRDRTGTGDFDHRAAHPGAQGAWAIPGSIAEEDVMTQDKDISPTQLEALISPKRGDAHLKDGLSATEHHSEPRKVLLPPTLV